MELATKCYSCGGDILFADGKNTMRCEYCGRMNARPKSEQNELELMKYANERLSFGEFDEAEKGYRKVLQHTPDEHEARWGLLLCRYGVRYVEDSGTGRRIPTCRKSLPTSFCAEPDFRLACAAAPRPVREEYEKDGRYIDDVQREIRRLKAGGEAYDVFICYKEKDENRKRTIDSVLAQNLYQTLALRGFRVFYAPLSLKNRLGANYEAAIYCALESSQIMLVLATKPEYLETTWVKSEWRRYLDRIDQGENKLLIPVYRDFSPERLPAEFSSRFLQGLNMSEFSFLSDLQVFLSRMLAQPDEEREEEEGSRQEKLMERGFVELEDGDFEAATECFEELLDEDVKNLRANLGMAMAELRAGCESALIEACCNDARWEKLKYFRRLERYGDEETAALLARIREACAAAKEAAIREEEARHKAEEEAARKAEEEAQREAVSKTDEADFKYAVTGGKAWILACKCRTGELRIPDTLGGYPVKAIGERAFRKEEGLIRVVIPDSVSEIGEMAFAECRNLEQVVLPEGMRRVRAYTFFGCTSLKEIVIPASVKGIESYAFQSCAALERVVLPEDIEEIQAEAFVNCKNLRRVEPQTCLARFEKTVFAELAARSDGVEADYEYSLQNGQAAITAYRGEKSEIVIPTVLGGCPVVRIGKEAFRENSRIERVHIPEGITAVGEMAFAFCYHLQRVDIPRSATEIAQYAFCGCRSLERVVLPEGMKQIRCSLFWQCDELREIVIPDGVESIGTDAFGGCDALERVVLPDSLKEIGRIAFRDCVSLRSVQLPGSLEKLGEECFSGSAALERILVTGTLSDALRGELARQAPGAEVIEEGAGDEDLKAVLSDLCEEDDDPDYAYTEANGEIVITGYTGRDADIKVPASIGGKPVAAIAESAFAANGAVCTVIIPEGVKRIGKNAFRSCVKLVGVYLPDSLESIGEGAFALNELESIALPDSLLRIGGGAFFRCDKLKQIRIPEKITELEPAIFEGCWSLEKVELPEGLKHIKGAAFKECRALKQIDIPPEVETIWGAVFGASGLTSIVLPKNLQQMGGMVFADCKALSAVVELPPGITEVPFRCFSQCKKLPGVILPEGLTTICEEAFRNCDAITEMEIPDSVSVIEKDAFYGCSGLKQLKVGRKTNVAEQYNPGMKIRRSWF